MKTRTQKIREIEAKYLHGNDVIDGMFLLHAKESGVVCQMYAPRIRPVYFTVYQFYEKFIQGKSEDLIVKNS